MSKQFSQTSEAGLLYGVDPTNDNVVNPLKITTEGNLLMETQTIPSAPLVAANKRSRNVKNTSGAGILYGVDPNNPKMVNPVKVTSDGKLLVEVVGGNNPGGPGESMPAWASTNW